MLKTFTCKCGRRINPNKTTVYGKNKLICFVICPSCKRKKRFLNFR